MASELEYSRPTVLMSGLVASIMSRMKAVFSASEVPVTLLRPVRPAASGSEIAAYTMGMSVPSAAVTMHWAARVAMGMMRSTPSPTTCAPIWFRTVASFWPLNS